MKPQTNDVEFNQRAHEIIRCMLNECEDRLICGGICDPSETEDYLCREYVAQVASLMNGASYFVQSEAAIGAEIFMSRLCGEYSMGKFNRYTKMCGRQLSYHTILYFRRYPEVLTQMYVERLQAATPAEISRLNKDGIIQLAAASLPYVLEELRRELRRHGLKHEHVIAFEDDRDRRLTVGKNRRRQIGKD